MGPTRKRDLTVAAAGTAAVAYLLVMWLYRWFPPITAWTGISLLAVAVAETGWGRHIQKKLDDGKIGDAPGWLHPLAVARSLVAAKASAWVGALVLGWWAGVLAYLVPRRSEVRVADADTPGAIIAAGSAAALILAALWLQHCCKSSSNPPESDRAPEN